MKKTLLFLLQLAFICVIYTISHYIVKLMHIPIPASVLGMILLFVGLLLGIVKVEYIEIAATFLVNHLAFFFIPFAVGLMAYGDLIKSSGWQLLIMIIGSTIIGLLITSGLTNYFSEKESKKHERSHSV